MNSPASTPASLHPGQPLTPALQSWIAAQKAQGRTRHSIFKSMLDAGWLTVSASLALGLSDEENAAFGVPLLAELLKPVVALPKPVLDARSNMVDAGDKWVQVLAHQNDLQEVVFGNLLSPAECDALIEQATPRLLPGSSPSLSSSLSSSHLTSPPGSASDCQSMAFARSENAVVQRVEARIAKLLHWPAQSGEDLQIHHYRAAVCGLPAAQLLDKAQSPDFFVPEVNGRPSRGGRRIALLRIFLTQPEAGFVSDWQGLQLTAEPRRGNAFFSSYSTPPSATPSMPAAKPSLPADVRVLPAPVWIATKWLRERECS